LERSVRFPLQFIRVNRVGLRSTGTFVLQTTPLGTGGSPHMHILLVLAAAASMNDNQIANIALTAHQIDVDRGKMALKHTHNDEVKQFAEQMVNDHQAGIDEAKALAGRLGVKPERSDTSKSLQADAKKAATRLKKEKG